MLRLARTFSLCLAALTCALSSHAAFHIWNVSEVYSNADGTIQYIEISTQFGGQQFLQSFNATLTSTSGGTTRTFAFPTNLPGDTAGKTALLATQGFANLNLVTPDYIIPDNFVFQNNGAVTFVPSGSSISYMALPTSATSSLGPGGAVQTNSPKNFANVSATLSVPGAPAISGLVAGDGRVQMRFAAPGSSGSAAIVLYRAKCNNGGADVVVQATGSPVLLTGMTNLSLYSCRVSAVNAIGNGPDSAIATVTPDSAAVPTLLSAVSRKNHGAAGMHDVPLNVTETLGGNPSVEPRNEGPAHTLVLNFNVPIFSVGLVSLTDPLSGGLCCVAPTYNGFDTTLSITNLPALQRLTVTLEAFNGGGMGASFPLVFMPGDVTNSRRINAADISAVKARAGAVNASNARFDLNLDGTISSSDTSIAKSKSGTVAQ